MSLIIILIMCCSCSLGAFSVTADVIFAHQFVHNVSVAESSTARDKPPVKKTSAKGHEHRVKRTKQRTKETAENIDSEATNKTLSTAASEDDSKCKQWTDNGTQRSSSCKLFSVPEIALYEHFIAKLKRPAYIAKMKKRLVKYEGKMRHGKDIVHVSRKNLVKLLSLLDIVANTDSVKSKKRKHARKISKLLQTAVHP